MEKKNFFAPLSKGLGATRRAAAMLLLVMLLTTATAWAQWSGNGTSDNPYKISSAADLARIRTMMNSGSETFEDRYFVQTADIDCSDMAVWNDNQGAGIGRDASHAFKGRYDGGGYEIRNLLITATNSQYAGLFGYIVGGQYQGSVSNTHIAEVHGVVLVNPTITITATSSEQYVGAIVGYAGDCSQIYDNTVIGGTVTYTGGSNYNTNSSHVGGIVGRYGSSNLPRLTGNAVVGTSLSGAGISGGLVGYLTIYYGFYDNFADASISSADFGTAGLKREGALVGSYHHYTSSFTSVNYYHSASGLTAYGGNYTFNGSSYSISPVADDERAAPLYTVSTTDGVTASCTPTVTYGGTDYYASGTTVTLSSIVPTGQHLTTYKANDINLPGNTYTMGSSDVCFSRVLEYNTYNITYNLNGGSVATPNPDTFNVESETFQLNNPTKPGYTFIGWTGSNGNTPQMEVTITKGSTEDRTYNANYEFARITVGSLTYECTSGTEAKVIACNNSATSVTIPTTVSNNDGTYSVTAIEATAFSGCTSLLAVILASETPQTLGSGALDGCTALNAISVPAGSVETYKDAAGWSNYADKIQGYEGKCGDNVYYAYDRITKTLRIFGTGTIEGCPWSRYCMDITTVIIGNGVTSIGDFGVFNNCTSLTSVVIPASVTSIGIQAFMGCRNLTSITIPASVTSIGFQAFLDCHLTSIAIPASVTSIGNGAFYGCSSLETISVADGNTVYDSRIIEKATNKLLYGCKNTVIPDNVTSIGDMAFSGCSGLTSIEIPASVTSIEDGAFYGCTGLETISVADGNTVYDSRNNCNAIIEKETNTLIQGCKTTIIPASVTSIYDDAFKGCTGLTDVTIPASVTSIGERAFFLCAGLESVIIYAPSLEYYGSYAFDNNASGRKIYVPSSSVDAYKAGWSQYAGNIVGFDACGTNVYYVYDSSAKTLHIFGTGNMADYDDTNMPWYSYCENIAKVVIEGGVTSIDTNAFKGCSSLNTVVMKDVTPLTLAAGAFDNCTALHAIYVPAAAVETYKDATGWSAYAGKIQGYDGFCGDDVYYSFDSSTKALRIFGTGNMANYIFSDYRPWNSYIYNIQTVVIEDGVTSIDRDAFSGCSGLTSIEIPASVTSIGNGAFYGCSSLETISVADGNTVYDSRTSIYDDAFRGCTGLASVTIYAPSLDFYGSYAFYDNAAGRKIYVFSDCVDTYKAGWSQYADDILPIEHLDVAANAHDGNYWTTFYCGHTGYKIDEGENAWAYTAEYDAGNARLTLHKLGKVIPKGTAVILVGADNSISMTASSEAAQYSVANNLHGTDIRTATSELGTGTFYVMGKQSGNFGFFPYTAQYMPARKAYLLVDGGAAQARGLTMTFDETTGISSTTNDTNDTNDKAWYTLDGRKLDGKPTTKGLYIHNGKKTVIK